MDLNEAIAHRRSIRKYTDKIVQLDDIKHIIEAGTLAPTACNKQGARFLILQDKRTLARIVEAGTAHFVKNCQQAILVLYDNRIDNVEYHDDILSAGAVIQNMLLKASSMGIATCWVCNLPAKSFLRKLCSIPTYYDPISLITIGYQANVPSMMPRKYSMEEVMFVDIFDSTKDKTIAISNFKLFMRKQLRKIYIRLPKGLLLSRLVDRFEKKFDN